MCDLDRFSKIQSQIVFYRKLHKVLSLKEYVSSCVSKILNFGMCYLPSSDCDRPRLVKCSEHTITSLIISAEATPSTFCQM